MLVGGVPVDERLLRRLAEVVPPAVARRLDMALFYRAAVLGLTSAERRAILAALENPPSGLENLRATLVQDPSWRQPDEAVASSAANRMPPTGYTLLLLFPDEKPAHRRLRRPDPPGGRPPHVAMARCRRRTRRHGGRAARGLRCPPGRRSLWEKQQRAFPSGLTTFRRVRSDASFGDATSLEAA